MPGARYVECSFLIPIRRDSDGSTHRRFLWRSLEKELRRQFGGRTGPETLYRDVELVRGEYDEGASKPPTRDVSRRYVVAIREEQIANLRTLLRRAAKSFDQRAVYLSVAGDVEFVEPTDGDDYLE